MKDIHTHIDGLLRQRLAEATVPPQPASGWEMLERELDAVADASLREALTDVATVSVAVAGWETLERKLDPRPVADQVLAEKLTGLVSASATGWSALAVRLDLENDKAVDTIVAAGLNTSTGGTVSGWAALAARLELIGWRRSSIAAWKIMEGALLMSLLLLLVRFGPADTVFADLGTGFPLATNAALAEHSGPAIRSENLNDTPASPTATTNFDETVTSDVAVTDPVGAVTARSFAVVAEVVEVPPVLAANTDVVALTDVVPATATIARLGIEPLQRQTVLPSPMVSLPKIPKSEPVYYYVNTFLSPLDVNQVITRNKEFSEVAVEGARRFTNGLSGGFLLDFSKGKNIIQVGVIMAHRSYASTPLDWKSEEPDLQGYQRFKYTSFELPFNYKRVLRQTNNWRISGRVGMSMNVIASSVFHGEEEVSKSVEIIQDGPQLRPGAGTGDPFGRDKGKFINPDKGWLEGGSIFANSSFYLGGGVIIERLMTPRWSLYLSPSIGRVVYLNEAKGIGPTNDRIHTGSLRMGSRYLFGGGGDR